MDNGQEHSTDLAALVVPQAGRLVATEDPWEPYQLLDPPGAVVEDVSAWFRDLQAAGRSAATLRSYGLDLLRWYVLLGGRRAAPRSPSTPSPRPPACRASGSTPPTFGPRWNGSAR